MSLTLTWTSARALAIDATILRPESFLGQSPAQVGRTWIPAGNEKIQVGELFRIEGDAGDDRLTLEGDLIHLHKLGRGMTRGLLLARGDVGALAGAEMQGGTVQIEGSAGDWAGAEMRGGTLRIAGNAGSYLGAAYPGSRLGMREGVILVEGAAGDDAGVLMRRGLIAIRGNAGAGLGRAMIAGTVLALGTVGRYVGAGMKRGTILLPGLDRPADEVLLPSFPRAGRFAFPYVTLYYNQLAEWGFPVPAAMSSPELERYNGDLVAGGQGEILVGQAVS